MKDKINNSKIIHYCWFGPKPLTKVAKKCLKSWKKFLPDYEIMLWNETNFDFNQNSFVKGAYESKKWAFVADYARLKKIEEYGGIYFDTDIEITKDITPLLDNECFLGVEDSGLVNAAILYTKHPHNKFVTELITIYDGFDGFNKENDLYKITIPAIITKKLEDYGGFKREKDEIQKFDNDSVTIYPREYFYPLSYDYQNNRFTNNTYMIHHYDATWASKPEKIKLFFRRHNMGFMMRVVDICVSIKIRIKRILNVIKGIPNEKI